MQFVETTLQHARIVSHKELSLHRASSQDPWIAIHGVVYRLQNWLDKHPGGRTILLLHAGTDATAEFDRHHPTTRYLALIEKEKIGSLANPNNWTEVMDNITRIENTAFLEERSLTQSHFPVAAEDQMAFLEKRRELLEERTRASYRKSLILMKDDAEIPELSTLLREQNLTRIKERVNEMMRRRSLHE